jgi:outer membrane protein OmpA-like peptidoglycan-associated protein
MLAVATVAFPATLAFSDTAFAQKFFTHRQIVQQLNVQQNGGNFEGQSQKRKFSKKRVMQPELQAEIVVQEQFQAPKKFKRRVPMPENGGQFESAGNGNIKTFRAPQPEGGQFGNDSGGTIVQEMRVPGVNENVAKRRAPQPQNDDIVVASGGNQTEIRGIDIRKKKKVVEQVAVGQQVASAGEFEATGTNYPGNGRIDLEILFDYDSDRISPASVKQLIALGDALNDPSLGNSKFVIAGHTDATGSNYYNDDLSRRRAAAVTEFLVVYAGIDPRRLIPEGYGEELLKYPDAPESGQNRRVEIINLGDAG